MRFLPLAVVVGAALGAAAAVFLLLGDRGDGWKTYRNEAFGYEFRYPPDWELQVRDPQPGGDFETQNAGVTKDGASVGAYVNFQGGWCETAARIDRAEIVVSGVRGEEHVCYGADAETPVYIAILFDDAKGKDNYMIHANAGPVDGIETVRRIIATFRFLD